MPASAEDPALAVFPGCHLAHLDRSVLRWGTDETSYFTLYPIAVPRPAAGKITAPVICGSCGMSVKCTIYSLAGRRWLRRRRIAGGCVLLGAVFLLDCCTGLFVSGHREPAMAGWNDLAWILVGFVSVCLSFSVLPLFIPSLSVIDGVFVRRKGGHSIRRPGSTVGISSHKEPNF